MGLFDFFKKSESYKVKDYVWMDQHAKLKGCLKIAKARPDTKFVAWFEDTGETVRHFFQQHTSATPEIILASHMSLSDKAHVSLVFLEHYPWHAKEEALFSSMQSKEIFVVSALDEPLFQKFGGEQIIDLMKRMGMKEEDHVEHSMISRSIKNAQEKLGKKIQMEKPAHSAEEWFRKNIQ